MAKKPKSPMATLKDGPLEPASAVVLYNRRTGVIFSTHYFSVTNDATLPDTDELERVAREHAAKDGCDARTHDALHVDPAALKLGVSYRVRKGVLTEVKADNRAPKPLAATRSKPSR